MLRATFLTLVLFASACAVDTDESARDGRNEASPSEPPTRTDLTGAWRSTEDGRYSVSFGDGQFAERYDGDVAAGSEVAFRIDRSCEGALSEEAGRYLVLTDDRCYYLADLTADTLRMRLVGGRGNTLSFRRVGE